MPIPNPLQTDRDNLGKALQKLGGLTLMIPMSAAATQPGASLANMATSVQTICGILQNGINAGHITLAQRQAMAVQFNAIATQLVTPP